jgi:single-stranded-DNA-specific exonuclease
LVEARWDVAQPPDPGVVGPLASALSIPEPLAMLLVQRGFDAPAAARAYLRPALDSLHDPSLLKDMAAAVDLVATAIRRGDRILVHGDYDVDGQCAATLLTRILRAAGADAEPFVPHRVRDGYDFGPAGLARAAEIDAGLIVTCDCGTTAIETVERARAAGRAVIVTDHHLARVVAPANALINPQQPGCDYPDKDLCGTGVAFKLAQAVARELGLSEHLPMHFLDLVALATVADVVPLRGENRILTRHGLRLLSETRWPGLRALIEVTGLRAGSAIRAGQVGFILAPRLNATGRIGEAMDGVRLLMTDDADEARRLAGRLDEINGRRQAMDADVLEQALALVERDVDLDATFGLVVASDGWHPGVIGLVASRLVERYCRPAVLIALDGEEGKGSGRSIGAFDLHGGLARCADHLERFGGHRMAAGLSVRRECVAGFKEAFEAVTAAELTDDDVVPRQRVDVILPLAQLNEQLERLLRYLEPCGAGNPGPVLGVREVTARAVSVAGTNHLRFTMGDGTGTLGAIAFGWADRVAEGWWSSPVDVALKLETNEWKGRTSLQGRVMQIRTEAGAVCGSSRGSSADGA